MAWDDELWRGTKNLWAKHKGGLSGAGLGFMVAGPIGAAFGAAAGHYAVDKDVEPPPKGDLDSKKEPE